MNLDYQTWLNLVKYHTALNTNKSLRSEWVDKFVDARDYRILGERHADGFTPEQMANEIALFVEEYRRQREEKNQQRALAGQNRRLNIINKMNDRIEGISGELEERRKSDINQTLGMLVGNEIVYRYLYTLSTDCLQTYKIVDVSKEDYEKYHTLDKEWEDAKEGTEDKKEKWNAYLAFSKSLQKKYLPPKIECYFYNLDCITDMDKFRYGISSILWDCDMSHYNVTNFDIEEDGKYHTKITLYLDVD